MLKSTLIGTVPTVAALAAFVCYPLLLVGSAIAVMALVAAFFVGDGLRKVF